MNLLASDFDNTLWFTDHMKEKDIQAIKTFQEQGNLFGVCTGRALNGIVIPSQPYQLQYDFYILLSGALILNKDKEVIFEKQISFSLVKDIYEFLDQKDMSIVYQDTIYKIYKNKEDDDHGIMLDSIDQLQTEYVSAFSFHYAENEIDEVQKATKRINQQYGHIIEAYQNNRHIDLAAKGCSKGHGMKIIQDYFLIKPTNIYGIGDSYNDLPMFKAIENSYSFPYAPSLVQEYASQIVESLAECIQDIEKHS